MKFFFNFKMSIIINFQEEQTQFMAANFFPSFLGKSQGKKNKNDI